MRTIICGGRKVVNMLELKAALKNCGWVPTEVVCGKANGADSLGNLWAIKNNIPVKYFEPNWKDLSHPDAVIRKNLYGQYDARAGIRRNHEMGDYAEACIALWDKKSVGTRDMIEYASKKGLKVHVHIVGQLKIDLDNSTDDSYDGDMPSAYDFGADF